MKFSFLTCASIGFAAALSTVRADDEPADLDLPQPFDAASAQTILDSSPFTRSLNLSDSLTLTGIAYVEGKPVATLRNRATKESFIVSDEPNSQGWKLTTASPDSELRHTQVKIMVGPEIVTVRYGDEQLSPEHAKRSSGSSGSSRESSPMMSYSGSHYRSSSYLGENGAERYKAMSDTAREKFKDNMHKLIDKHPEMTPEQRSVYAEKYFAKAQAEDQGQNQKQTASVKSPKPPKGSR